MRSGYDRLLMGSPLRRSRASKAIAAALLVILACATLVQLVVFTGMPPGLFGVFLRAFALSSLLALVPLSILWFLDRRERESPWLFTAAFLWGGLIATALALPFNTAFFKLVDEWLTHHPMLAVILGPEAPMMLVAPISAPIVEELAKALGVLLLFWLLRPEFDNMRDGLVYGALVGLGFTWYEAALYVVNVYAKIGVAAYGLQLGARYALFRLGGHAFYRPLRRVSGVRTSDSARMVAHSRSNSGARPRHRGPHAKQLAAAVCNTYEDRRRQATTGQRTDP